LIACEPAITPVSGIFYRLMHPEPVDMSANPLSDGPITAGRDPFESNQAIPTLLVGRYHDALKQAVPGLDLASVDRMSFLAYPLCGGFQHWSLLPLALANPLLALEWKLRRLLGRLAAFRLLVVYEKRV
jgi:hypothetical protein